MADFDKDFWPYSQNDANVYGGTANGEDWVPTPATPQMVTNRTWSTILSAWVFWQSPEEPDPTGLLYPGPGTFGADTTGYAFIAPVAGA